jgi:hypothetical protein
VAALLLRRFHFIHAGLKRVQKLAAFESKLC